ncbi:MAG: glutamine synthetase III [Thermoguttaceae bacterium]|nr:glutamine synthetase III [Thermoguttaceae bacterium]
MNASNRNRAIDSVAQRTVQPDATPDVGSAPVDYYGKDVFSASAIRKYLSRGAAEKLLATIQDGAELDPSVAGDVAHAMKDWAISRGATHFTHWFQPMTGSTAEKHDAFLDVNEQGEAIMTFSGSNLVKSEPDASSFPSGGLRCTFEARGYTTWDPTSPAFVKRNPRGATLCIPSIFCSYNGDVLDKKLPLLRSIQALKQSVSRFMDCFQVPPARTTITLGAEQEYFLIDRNFYLQRPDLLQTGRTLFGSPPAKHQQLEDHYFGAIKPRILNFMAEVEEELWRLGIPARTRHNEVAPAQFELAPTFEDLNLAVDHNMLTMEILRRVAEKNGLVCLLHEKPFAGVNGSGKHNNWSVMYGSRNLLDPGDDPRRNPIFLAFLTAIIRAVDLHGDLLRCSTVTIGNDYRLGANEAPPAIMSIYLGKRLNKVLQQVEDGVFEDYPTKVPQLQVGVATSPNVRSDDDDRNRTSPLAFTGNKFEFRACGSSQSCAGFNIFMNVAVAESLDYISDRIEKFVNSPSKFESKLQTLLGEIIAEHKRIIYNENNYSQSWIEEAEKRGLPNLKTSLEALRPLLDQGNQQLLEKYKVFKSNEMLSRHEIMVEEYVRKIQIEGEVTRSMAQNLIFPVVLEEYGELVQSLKTAQEAGIVAGLSALKSSIEAIGSLLDEMQTRIAETAAIKVVNVDNCQEFIQKTRDLRQVVDRLEKLVDDRRWPLPKYREMLFIY